MILPQFELVEPNSVNEACDILRGNQKARIIAGGTDLLVNMKKKVIKGDLLVSLDKIPDLKTISFPDGVTLSLGSMLTIADIAESTLVKANFPVLGKAAGKLGSPQIRNRATIGGNVCTARPAGDTIGPLIAYGAMAQITGLNGVRTQPLDTLFRGPGQTSIGSGEILTAITLKKPGNYIGGSYVKYANRKAMEIALVSVTTLVYLEGEICRSARVVLGAVAPTFVRCHATEEFLIGKKITDDMAEQAGKLVISACNPITDMRASADYRRNLVQILVKRSLLEAVSSVVN
jgi:CO/xanthine dehydrogenase FAD-binding subunit